MKEIGEPECGHCVWIVSKKEAFVGEGVKHLLANKGWAQIMRESVYVPAKESYAPLAQYIINSCEQAGCNSQVDRFKVKLPVLGSP